MELELDDGRRRWVGAGVAGAILVGGVVSAALLLATNAAGPSAPGSRPPTPSLRPHVVARIEVGYMPSSVALAGGSVWVVVRNRTQQPHEAQLVRIDPTTNRVVARIPMTRFSGALASKGGVVWADGAPWPFRVLRIDSTSNRIRARIQGAAGFMAYGAGSLWTWGHQATQQSIVRIDPDTNRIAATISVPYAMDLTFGDGRLWVLVDHPGGGRNNRYIIEIDPGTNTVTRRFAVQNGNISISAGGGAVWVQGWSGIVRIDERTGRHVRIRFRSNFRPFAYGEGGVWFVGGSPHGTGSRICRLSAVSLRVDSCVDPGGIGDLEVSHPVLVLDRRLGTIWVSNFRNTVTRIDLR